VNLPRDVCQGRFSMKVSKGVHRSITRHPSFLHRPAAIPIDGGLRMPSTKSEDRETVGRSNYCITLVDPETLRAEYCYPGPSDGCKMGCSCWSCETVRSGLGGKKDSSSKVRKVVCTIVNNKTRRHHNLSQGKSAEVQNFFTDDRD